jgi:K+-sensing histidine kinase KdpD
VLAGEDDAELLVVHVDLADGLRRWEQELDRYRRLADDLGARFQEVHGTDAARSLADVARRERAHRIVVAARRPRLSNALRGSVASRIRRRAPGLRVDEVEEPVGRTRVL